VPPGLFATVARAAGWDGGGALPLWPAETAPHPAAATVTASRSAGIPHCRLSARR